VAVVGTEAAGAVTEAAVVGAVAVVVVIAVIAAVTVVTVAIAGNRASMNSWRFSCNAASSSFLP
jgi:hypothetical protein